MNVPISEKTEQIIRSQVRSGRFASEQAVIDEAVRQLDSEACAQTTNEVASSADQELQRKLFAAGLISEIKPSIRVDTGTEQFTPIVIQGEPLSEMISRERR
jgi:Arc/MetJ-type ribon-helix-helix transcriptional regulator